MKGVIRFDVEQGTVETGNSAGRSRQGCRARWLRDRELLETIAREKPGSLTELAEFAGRSKSNLSRTQKTMSRYGQVELKAGERGTVVPRVPYDQVRLDVALTTGPREVA